MALELSGRAQRVLGCLIEKALATPQQYPLTLNSLRLACNQSTGREPVVDYDENTVEAALSELREPHLVRTEVVRGSRTPKYSHRVEDELDLDRRDQAIVALLLLRGPQTEGELRSRSDRLYEFSSLDEVDEVLASLAGRGLVRRLERQPGEKAQRWQHLLGPAGSSSSSEVPSTDELVERDASVPVVTAPRTDEVGALRRRVEALEEQLDRVLRHLDLAADDVAPAEDDRS